MEKKEIKNKTPKKETAQPEVENTSKYNNDYTRHFYTNIERLWDAVQILQEENTQLRAQLKGEY